MILPNAGSITASWLFSSGYSVVYRLTDTLCLTVGTTVPTKPRNSVVCVLCRSSSDFLSDVLMRLGINISSAEDTVFMALMNIPVASTVSASNEMGMMAASAYL